MTSAKPKTKRSKPKTLAERLIVEFKLVRDKEFIRFRDGRTALMNQLAEAGETMALKYGTTNTQGKPIDLVHTSSFMKNPLRYIGQLIDQCDVTHKTKEKRRAQLREIVKSAMKDDPLGTVESIIFSKARVARF